MKTPTLPPYAPERPLDERKTYSEKVKLYGKSPRGYRWLGLGEKKEENDLVCYVDGKEWRRTLNPKAKICGMSMITLRPTPIKSSPKRDPKGRFAAKTPPVKVLPDLGETFRDSHSNDSLDALKSYVDCVNRVLANTKDRDAWYGIFGWSLTPQGFKYWSDRQDGTPPPSPDDLDYLRAAKEFFEKRIVELTPPAPKPPTVPELEAKILSLEAEVASLRRKIAGAKVMFPE